MRPMHFLFAIFVFSSAQATDWDETVKDRGTIVIVQQVLRAQGYDPGLPTGDLGPQTVEALKQAQKDRELEPTGKLDRRTVAALGIDTESAAAGASAKAK